MHLTPLLIWAKYSMAATGRLAVTSSQVGLMWEHCLKYYPACAQDNGFMRKKYRKGLFKKKKKKKEQKTQKGKYDDMERSK